MGQFIAKNPQFIVMLKLLELTRFAVGLFELKDIINFMYYVIDYHTWDEALLITCLTKWFEDFF